MLPLLLIAAILCAQWSGVIHRIEHARSENNLLHTLEEEPAAADHDADAKHHHSCIEFDAATLAVTIHGDCFHLPVIPEHWIALPGEPFISWLGDFQQHFLSRAPPYAP